MRGPRLGRALVAIAVAGFGTSACGSSKTPTTTPAPTTATTKVRPTHQRAIARLGPRVGATQLVRTSGTTLSVVIARIVDPLTDSGAALVSGTRAVGVLVRIHNHGPGVYDSSATGDVSVATSAGSGMPAFAPHGPCQTPLRDFDNYISPGEDRAGCVAFAIEAGAKIAGVRFSPHGQATGAVSWGVSP